MSTSDTHQRHGASRWALLLGGAVLLANAPAAQAGWLDNLFGKPDAQTEAARAGAGQRLWRIKEFTTVALVPREAGAAENQALAARPVALTPEALRQQLALVQSVGRAGAQPLFSADELADFSGPLLQALRLAGPADDVLLLSTARRDTGILVAPTAVTARLFVLGDALHLVVHDARFDFYDTFRGTQIAPRFSFGTRASAGEAKIQSVGATSRRADWLALPLDAAPPSAAAAPAPTAAPSAAPSAAPQAERKALDAAGADDIERRLETLKRLREKGLISEDEYQQKRKEILRAL